MNTVDPAHPTKHFATSTSTSSIRDHFAADHIDEWVAGCDKLNIKITAKTVQSVVADSRHERGKGQGKGVPAEDTKRPTFTHEAFVDAIVEWIVADDQVCQCLLYSSTD